VQEILGGEGLERAAPGGPSSAPPRDAGRPCGDEAATPGRGELEGRAAGPETHRPHDDARAAGAAATDRGGCGRGARTGGQPAGRDPRANGATATELRATTAEASQGRVAARCCATAPSPTPPGRRSRTGARAWCGPRPPPATTTSRRPRSCSTSSMRWMPGPDDPAYAGADGPRPAGARHDPVALDRAAVVGRGRPAHDDGASGLPRQARAVDPVGHPRPGLTMIV